ncbi:MAG: Crp/Fnr family transcriptional regulator [Lachnospiraceae bacterium]
MDAVLMVADRAMVEINKADSIKKALPFWENLNEEEVIRIENSMINRRFLEGELISGNADSCTGMVFVETGDVRVSIVSEDGRQISLFHVNEKELCVTTASCVISQLTFDTVVTAEKDTVLWVIPANVLERLAERNVHVKAYMYELLTERFSTVVWVMEQILFKKFDRRLAEFLLSCRAKSGKDEIVITQEAIAAEVNTAREVVARMLKRFAADNLVELKRGKIILKDIKSLEKI